MVNYIWKDIGVVKTTLLSYISIMCEENDQDKVEPEYNSYDPDDGIVLEWWGRAEGISDEQ